MTLKLPIRLKVTFVILNQWINDVRKRLVNGSYKNKLEKTYQVNSRKITVLKDIVRSPSKIVVVCAPSGSGKTTLLNVISGTDRPKKGEIAAQVRV